VEHFPAHFRFVFRVVVLLLHTDGYKLDATFLLLGAGLVGIGIWGRKRFKARYV